MIVWKAFNARVNYLAFSPDGTRLVTCSDHAGVKVFDAVTGRERWHHAGDGRRNLWHAVFTPDGGRVVLLADHRVLVLAADDGRELARFSRMIAAFAPLPDGEHLVAVTTGMDTCELKSLALAGGRCGWRKPLTYHGSVLRLIASPDGRHWATVGGFEGLLFDAAARKIRLKLPDKRFDHNDTHLAFSPDGRTLVFTAGAALHVCDVDTATLRETAACKGAAAGEVAFTADGGRLLRVGKGGRVGLWDTTTWELAQSYDWKAGTLNSVTVSPDGTRAAVASNRGIVVVWDVDD